MNHINTPPFGVASSLHALLVRMPNLTEVSDEYLEEAVLEVDRARGELENIRFALDLEDGRRRLARKYRYVAPTLEI